MKILSTSYTNTPGFNDPVQWLDRIDFYTGILEALAKDHEVESIEQISYTGELEREGVKYHFLDLKKSKNYFPQRLHGFIKKRKPDVVLVNGFIFPLQVMQLRMALGKAVKIIILHRGEKPCSGIKGSLQKMADQMINAYLFSSAEFGKVWIRAGNMSDQQKIHEVIQASSVFKPGNRTIARSELQVKGSPLFLWVGRLNENKDPRTVVKAFLKFLKLQPAAKLYMIYQTEELLPEIRSLLQQEEAPGAIALVGKVPHDELQNWYNAADFIISGSHHEGSGIGVCEAMSCGCVPVVTDIISFRAMTGNGKCGMRYEPGNEAGLLNALLQANEMDMEAERQRTLQQFNEELSFEAIAKKIKNVIKSC
jgi:glycosyltransferase involved in cell wall biosynthesis